jgi:hypothetical protein
MTFIAPACRFRASECHNILQSRPEAGKWLVAASAYNDTYTLLAWLFLIAMPFILLLPRKGVPLESSSADREV